MELYHADCFDVFPDIEDHSVDLVLVDLPYAQTSCKWDICIDLEKMWKELARIAKVGANFVFTTTTKFGYKLIQSNEKGFRYDLVWEKNYAVGFLNANKQPLRNHEMIYVFGKGSATYVPQKTEGKPYESKGGELPEFYCGNKKRSGIENTGDRHPKSVIHETTYNPQKTPGEPYPTSVHKYKNTDKNNAYGKKEVLTNANTGERHPKSVIHETTYNPQKTEGKPYTMKRNGAKENNLLYGNIGERTDIENTGDRYPKSIVPITNDNRGKIHPTQKPVALMEWLIKTYSNEGDLVLDFCAGSGSTGVACMRTNRKCILIEKDLENYNKMEININGNIS